MSRTERQYTLRLSAAGHRQLTADLKALGVSGEKSLQRIQRATKPASAGLQVTDRSARDLSAGLRSVGNELPALQRLTRFLGPAAVGGALTAFAKGSLDVGRAFEAAMKAVAAATGEVEAALDALAQKARDVGATTAFTAMEAATAIEVLAKNGLDVEDILSGALDATVALAGALGAELAPSADLVTDAMAQFSLQAADLPRVADLLSGAALTSKFGFDDLRQAIGQAGGVAGSYGLTVEDLVAGLSATASSFSSGSDAGTSFKTFLQRLTPQSKQAADLIRQMGLEFYDAQGNLRALAEIAGELQDSLAGLNAEARNDVLLKIFGTDAIRTALSLAEAGADGLRDLAGAIGEVSAVGQAEVRLQGLNGALRELAAAWEALQLQAADRGGLDAADGAVRRLTEALRFLTENFDEVNEIVERVAQALVVVLVGKGISLAVARAVAMRAAYIELAASVTGVGTAAARAVGPMTRLGVAGRVLLGTLGGPLGAAITALSLASLAIDLDSTADAMEASARAGDAARGALEDYAAASKRAADEQAGLGGEVEAVTGKILLQSRAQLQAALRDQRAAREELMADLRGEGLFDRSEINRLLTGLQMLQEGVGAFGRGIENRNVQALIDALQAVMDGSGAMTDVLDAYERIAAVGPEALDVLEGPIAGMVAYAEMVGVFEDELAAFNGARKYSQERTDALMELMRAIRTTERASREMSGSFVDEFVASARAVEDADKAVRALEAALEGNFEMAAELAGIENPFKPIEEGADAAGEAVESLSEAMDAVGQKQIDAWQQAGQSRAIAARGEQEAADQGILALIRFVEGTTGVGNRGYNETLGYGAFTGGPVNLISMTLREVLELQKQMLAHPDNTFNSSAAGAYQIVSTTLRGLIDDLGLDMGQQFTPALQDRLAQELIRQVMAQGGSLSAWGNMWQGFEKRGTQLSTINRAMGGQVLPTVDPAVSEAAAASERLAAEATRERAEAIRSLVLAGEDQLAQLELERQLTGATAAEAARLTYIHEQLTAARRAGIDVETAMTASGERLIDVIYATADALAVQVEAREANRAAALAEAASVEDATGAVRAAFDNLRPGGDGLKGFFSDLFGFIGDKLWDLAWDPVWDTLGGLFSGLVGGIGGAAGGAVSAAATGGTLPRFAGGGGKVPGIGHSRQDNMLGWFSPGEFTMPVSAVDYYGTAFMEDLRHRRLPRFATGGGLMPASGPAAPAPSPAEMRVSVGVEGDGSLAVYVRDAFGRLLADARPRLLGEAEARFARSMRTGPKSRYGLK